MQGVIPSVGAGLVVKLAGLYGAMNQRVLRQDSNLTGTVLG
jgi:hypothetical protein